MGHTAINEKQVSTAVLLCGFATYSSPFSAPIFRFKKRRECGVKFQVGIRDGVTFESVTAVYSETDFKTAFRMPRRTFSKLLDVVRPSLSRNIEMGHRSKRPTIPADIRLAIALRMFAGGKAWDMVGHVQGEAVNRREDL